MFSYNLLAFASAEEKRQLIAVKYEEKLKRENKIVADFKDIVQDKMESVTKGGGYH